MPGVKKHGSKTVGWRQLVEKPPSKPEGYSTTKEIAAKLGISQTAVRDKLRNLREQGKIDAVKVFTGRCWTWAYKD